MLVTTLHVENPAGGEAKAAPGVLPAGWTAHVDESTGATYYLNATSGETTWARRTLSSSAATS